MTRGTLIGGFGGERSASSRSRVNKMTPKSPKVLMVAGLAAILWIVPSIGTQGMGTIGQRFSHPDAALADGSQDATSPAARAALARADAAVEGALGF